MRAACSRRRGASRLAAAVALLAAGCARAPREASVLATFDGGEVEAAELERVILEHPPGQRAGASEERIAWHAERVRDVAMQEILAAEATHLGLLREPEIAARWRDRERQLVAGRFLAERVPPEPAGEEEVRAFFEEHRGEFGRPAQREVYHLYLRRQDGEPREALQGRMEALRQRVLAGEEFAVLARAHSDSQLRYQDGRLGWVRPGQLPLLLDRTVFALEPGGTSEVLPSDSGAHLLHVARALDAEKPDYALARGAARRLLEQQRWTQRVDAFLAEHDRADAFVPSPEEFAGILGGGDGDAVVLRVETWTLTLRDFVARLEEQGVEVRDASDAYAQLRALERLEEAHRLAEEARLAERAEVRADVEAAHTAFLVEAARHRLLVERAEGDPGRLEEYFDLHRRRFAAPPRWRLRWVEVPLGPEAPRVMERLRSGRRDLQAGTTTVERLAAELRGEARAPSWWNAATLERQLPELLPFLAAAQPGEVLEPLRTGRALLLVEVLEREEPQEQPLERVRAAVIEAFLAEHGRQLLEELRATLLDRHGFRLFDDRLARWIEESVGPVSGAADEGGTG